MIKEILAYVFRKLSSKHRSSTFDLSDIKISLLFDLEIVSEEQINRIIEKAKQEGLIEILEDNKVIPLFDYLSVEIPPNIQKLVSSASLEEDIPKKILQKISEKTGKSLEKLEEELNKLQREYPIFYPEVLALYLAFIEGLEILEFVDLVKNAVKSKNLEFDEI